MIIKFLSFLIPNSMYDEVRHNSTNNMQDAASALQWHIYEGLCDNYQKEIQLLNLLPIGSFPQYYSKAFVKQDFFDSERCKNNINVGFCNIKVIRKFLIPNTIFRELMKVFNGEEEGILFVYTINEIFMKPVQKFKKIKPNIRICSIVADLPSMVNLNDKNGIFKKRFVNYLSNKSLKRLSIIDAYVLLTIQMAHYLRISKPFCVIEGISTTLKEWDNKDFDAENLKIIMYSGTLHKRFGVLNLIEAFKKIKNENYRLYICGVGDSENDIIRASNLDRRIIYFGQLPRMEVLRLINHARLLVNPRQNNEDFTKYSFPSKIIEYLSSGTPVLAYKLDGVPDEYDDYLLYVNDNSIDSLAKRLIEVSEFDSTILREIGLKGKRYVQEKKNSTIQTIKVKEMMDKLS